MNLKSQLTSSLVLLGLVAATLGGYAFGLALPDPEPPLTFPLPPLSPLYLPTQTDGQFTAEAVSYYADATRLIFRFRITGERTGFPLLDGVDLYDTNGDFINSSVGYGPASEDDPSLFQFEFNPVTPLSGRLRGSLRFRVVPSPGEGEALAKFSFDLDLPVHPARMYNPGHFTVANDVEVLLDRLVITPAYTQVYLCYNKPTPADWTIGQDTRLEINGNTSRINEYALLFDSDFGDLGKGGEPGWTPTIQNGRCVKVGFPVGDSNPTSVILTIPALEQSTPEVIPDEELAAAREILLPEGIDISWQVTTFPEGGGASGPVFNKLPAGMSQQEAFEKFLEALGYFHEGPWIILVDL